VLDIIELFPKERIIRSPSGLYWPSLDLMWFIRSEKELRDLTFIGEYSHSLLSISGIGQCLYVLEANGTKIVRLILDSLHRRRRLRVLKEKLLLCEVALRRLLEEWKPLQQAHEAYTVYKVAAKPKKKLAEAYVKDLINESSDTRELYEMLIRNFNTDDYTIEFFTVYSASNIPTFLQPEDFALGVPAYLRPIERLKNLIKVWSWIQEESVSDKKGLFLEIADSLLPMGKPICSGVIPLNYARRFAALADFAVKHEKGNISYRPIVLDKVNGEYWFTFPNGIPESKQGSYLDYVFHTLLKCMIFRNQLAQFEKFVKLCVNLNEKMRAYFNDVIPLARKASDILPTVKSPSFIKDIITGEKLDSICELESFV
jgi:hypothetical protein